MDAPKPRSPILVNYLYFGFFLLTLMLFSTSAIFIKSSLDDARPFFLLYAYGQALLEVTGFILLGWTILRFLGSLPFKLFAGISFVCYTFHIFDFFTNRILDVSLFRTISIVFDGTASDFFFLLDASGVPVWMWLLFFASTFAIPWLGYKLYQTTEALSHLKPLKVKKETCLQILICVPMALFMWDLSVSRTIHPDTYHDLLSALPWKQTFLRPKSVIASLPGTLKPPPTQAELTPLIEAYREISDKPNLYLFVIETLRGDFITEEIAPNLSRFRKENISYDLSLSNANGTHLSWFSIFHSQFSYYWSELKQKQWSMGAPPLHILKKLGYDIHVYSSAELSYYGMKNLLFHSVTKDFHLFPHEYPTPAWQADQKTLETLSQDLADPKLQSGQVFLIFLDGTHFDYSWPKEIPLHFSPIAKNFSYFFYLYNTHRSIEEIKNRYRNAIHYLDSILGKCLASLPERSLIVITGDHGEEFFEEGHLFHNSHIVPEQTTVPLYFKFPTQTTPLPRPVLSHMDIFPTLIDYLSGAPPSFLAGESIFRPTAWPYALITRFNGARSPIEFCLRSAENHLIARFQNTSNPLASSHLHIVSLSSCKGRPLRECQTDATAWVEEEFGDALRKLVE